MNVIERVKGILISPPKEWDLIKGENLTVSDMFTKYAMILAAIPAIAGLLGLSLIGVSYGFGVLHYPFGSTLIWAILKFILLLGSAFALAFVIDMLAPTFGCTKNIVDAVKISVFSMTAMWVAGILYIVPALAVLFWLVSLYSLYILYLGIQKIKGPEKDKLLPYFIVSVVAAGIIVFIMELIANRIAFGSTAARLGAFGAF